jgi:hypothetical protein
MDHHYYG